MKDYASIDFSKATATTSYKIKFPPEYVGGYKIGNEDHSFQIALTEKPSWLHRKMMRWAFGWTWVDY